MVEQAPDFEWRDFNEADFEHTREYENLFVPGDFESSDFEIFRYTKPKKLGGFSASGFSSSGFFVEHYPKLLEVTESLDIQENPLVERFPTKLLLIEEALELTENAGFIGSRLLQTIENLSVSDEPTITVAGRTMIAEEALSLTEQIITAAQKLVQQSEQIDIFERGVDLSHFELEDFEELDFEFGLSRHFLRSALFQKEESLNIKERGATGVPHFEPGDFEEDDFEFGLSHFIKGKILQVQETLDILEDNLITLREIKLQVSESLELQEQVPLLLRAVTTLVNEIMNIGEDVPVIVRGRTLLITEALELAEIIITKLGEGEGEEPPPPVIPPPAIFFGARPKRKVKEKEEKKKRKKKKEEVRKLLVKDWAFVYHIEAPAPSLRQMLQELEIDRFFTRAKRAATTAPTDKAVVLPVFRHKVTKDVMFSYDIQEIVTKDVAFSYDILQTIQKDYGFAYEIKEVNWVKVASLQRQKAYLLTLDTIDKVVDVDESEDKPSISEIVSQYRSQGKKAYLSVLDTIDRIEEEDD